jgi:secretion/DNA translocation related CpaE-like protein
MTDRPLVLTGDPTLLDDLLRLTAVAGVEPEVAPDAAGAPRSWTAAPLVLVGADLADDLGALVSAGGVARRDGVVLVTADLDDAQVWRRAVTLGAEHVACLPDAEGWLVDRLAAAADGPGRGGVVVGVVGGRGGAGATVLACALAMAGLRAGLRTMLVDADPLGGGIDLTLGAEQTEGARWPALTGVQGRVSPGDLHDALPTVGELTVLSWDRGDATVVPPAAMRALLDAGVAGSDLVVVDLPRQLDASARQVVAAATTTLLVVPAEVRACAAAARVVPGLVESCADVRAVVRGPGPGRLAGELVAETLGIPLAASLRAEPHLVEALERGEPPGRGPGPLARLCDRLVVETVRVRPAAA